MAHILLVIPLALVGVDSVDEAIDLYLAGDMQGSISALEELLSEGDLTLDEMIRAYHRLGAAYYGMGEPESTREAFYQVLILDPFYDLGPWENPNLHALLDDVRESSMATVLVEGEPEGALLFIDGQYVGTTPYVMDNLIGGQSYSFLIHSEGFEPTMENYRTSPGQLHTMNYALDPLVAEADTSVQVAVSDEAPVDTASSAIASFEEPEVQPDEGTDVRPEDHGGEDGGQAEPLPAGGSGTASMSPEDLMELLGGGAEMAQLGEMVQLTQGGGAQVTVSDGSGGRNPELFSASSGQIETDTAGGHSMVFSEVAMNSEPSIQTTGDQGYSSRTSEEILEVLSEKTSNVTYIYNKHLRADPLLSGTVLIELVIEPSGRVSEVSILDSSTYNPAFDLELAQAVGTWRFGAVDDNEGPLTVQYPFSFSR